MNPTAPRNHSLDALRALAVAMVFAAHAIPLTAESPIWIERVATFGQRGVDLFFVLSGYLIGSIVLREFYGNGRISIFQFWRNRWYRTMPAYYVTLALYLLKELDSQALLSDGEPTLLPDTAPDPPAESIPPATGAATATSSPPQYSW